MKVLLVIPDEKEKECLDRVLTSASKYLEEKTKTPLLIDSVSSAEELPNKLSDTVYDFAIVDHDETTETVVKCLQDKKTACAIRVSSEEDVEKASKIDPQASIWKRKIGLNLITQIFEKIKR